MAALSATDIDKEILPFLSQDARADCRCVAMQYFLGLTGTPEGKTFISDKRHKYLSAIIETTRDKQWAIARDAYLSLINLSGADLVAERILDTDPSFIEQLLKLVVDSSCQDVNTISMLLSNLSRTEANSKRIFNTIQLQSQTIGLDKLILCFCRTDVGDEPSRQFHYLAPLLSNLTQIRAARHLLLDAHKNLLTRLLPFVNYAASGIRRGGVVGVVRNCCFESSYHDWIMGPDIDIVPALLLPLAAGGKGQEGFSEDEMEKLPMDLQYLDDNHKREQDPDIRRMILESLYQLCSGKEGRQIFKDYNAYLILRELHIWEKDPAANRANEDLVSLLISDEPEPGMQDLRKVEIPKDIEQKLKENQERHNDQIKKETQELELDLEKRENKEEIK